MGDNMKLPNLKEAQKRTKQEVLVKTNEYIVEKHLQHFGQGKKY